MTPTPAMALLSKAHPGWLGLTITSASGNDTAALVHRRQVVVGDQHPQPGRTRMRHAGMAGDAVVHRHQHVGPLPGLLRQRQVDDGRRQPVAVHRAVGHHVAQRGWLGPQQRQAAQRHGTGRGTVAVVVGDDADALALFDGVGQQPAGGGVALERIRGQQAAQAVVQFVGLAHAPSGEQARQQRVHAGLFEREAHARWHVTGLQDHSGSSTRCGEGADHSERRRSAQRRGEASKATPPRSPHSVSRTAPPCRASASPAATGPSSSASQALAQAAQSSFSAGPRRRSSTRGGSARGGLRRHRSR